MRIVRTLLNMYTIIMAVGALGLMVTALASPKKEVLPPLETPEQVAQAIDDVIQPRFQKDVDEVGIERILIEGHSGIYSLDTKHMPKMKTLLKRIALSRRQFAISFFHCIHKPAKFRGITKESFTSNGEEEGLQTLILPGNQYYRTAGVGSLAEHDRQGKWEEEQNPAIEKATTKVLPELRKGKPKEANIGKWYVAMRPVRAIKPSCLNCHTGAKKGDLMGVMVYSVSRTKEEMKKKRIISL